MLVFKPSATLWLDTFSCCVDYCWLGNISFVLCEDLFWFLRRRFWVLFFIALLTNVCVAFTTLRFLSAFSSSLSILNDISCLKLSFRFLMKLSRIPLTPGMPFKAAPRLINDDFLGYWSTTYLSLFLPLESYEETSKVSAAAAVVLLLPPPWLTLSYGIMLSKAF